MWFHGNTLCILMLLVETSMTKLYDSGPVCLKVVHSFPYRGGTWVLQDLATLQRTAGPTERLLPLPWRNMGATGPRHTPKDSRPD
jgi:hypothetical protein